MSNNLINFSSSCGRRSTALPSFTFLVNPFRCKCHPECGCEAENSKFYWEVSSGEGRSPKLYFMWNKWPAGRWHWGVYEEEEGDDGVAVQWWCPSLCRQVNLSPRGPFLLRLFFNVYQSFQSKLSRSTFYRANNIFLAALLRGGSSCCHCKAASRRSQSNSNQKHHFTSSFTTDSSTESQCPRSSWQTSCLLCLFLMATSERRPEYMDGVPFREQEETVLPPNNHHVWRLLQIQHEYYVVLHHVSLTSIPSLSLSYYMPTRWILLQHLRMKKRPF